MFSVAKDKGVYVKMKTSMIERFGLESIPQDKKTTSWKEYFIIQLAFSVNSGNFLVPALAVVQGGLPFYAAFLSTVSGAFLAFFCVSMLSLPGSRYGLPAQYVLRSVLGKKLSMRVASPVRTLTSLYWFSVQTIGGTLVVTSMIKKLTGASIPFIPVALGLALLMTALALVGFEAVKRASKWFIPILIAGQFILLALFLTGDQGGIVQHGTFSTGAFFFYGSLAFVQYISGVSAASDMTRYSVSPHQGFWGVLGGNMTGFIMTALLGGICASLYKGLNPFVTAGELTSSAFLLSIITISALVSMISINLSNAYTGGYSLLNALPHLSRIQSALLFSIAGVILSLFPQLVYGAEGFISLLGMLVVPLSAIIVSDFLLLRKGRLHEHDLAHLAAGTTGTNKTAIYVMVVGIALYALLPDYLSPGFLSFFFTGALYFFVNRIQKEKASITHQAG